MGPAGLDLFMEDIVIYPRTVVFWREIGNEDTPVNHVTQVFGMRTPLLIMSQGCL